MLKNLSKNPVEFTFQDLERWNNGRYKIEVVGDAPEAILCGERHARGMVILDQVELIRAVSPDFVLHEFMNGLVYNPKTRMEEMMPGREYDEWDVTRGLSGRPHSLIMDLSDELGFPLVGSDLTRAEKDKVMGRLMAEGSGRPHGSVLTDGSDEVMVFRDDKASEVALEYAGKTRKPLILIGGAEHIINIHQRKLLMPLCGYALIDQRFRRD